VNAPPRLEDLYDTAPVEVVLVGGLRAGERMPWPEPLPLIIELLDPVPDWLLPVMGGYLGPGTVPPPVSMSDRATAYQRTGGVRDDGAREYVAVDGRHRR
jgi:hypothetical protein